MPTGKIKTRRDVAQEVTDNLIKLIEDGSHGGWKRPWKTLKGGLGAMPVSPVGRAYRGTNQLILMLTGNAKGYPTARWGTYAAFKSAGAQVRKGERGTLVTFWKFLKVLDKDTGKEKVIPMVKGFSVFNAAQVDGWVEPVVEEAPTVEVLHKEAHEVLADYLTREGIGFGEGGDQAYYRPSTDSIQMPVHGAFNSDMDYLATMAHECGHSTGAEKRLNRQFGKRFQGKDEYAFEELVAELTATFFCCQYQIEQPDELDEQHAAYMANWLKVLKGDKYAIITAAGQAQKALDLITNNVWKESEPQEEA